jgi:hypothetical protein
MSGTFVIVDKSLTFSNLIDFLTYIVNTNNFTNAFEILKDNIAPDVQDVQDTQDNIIISFVQSAYLIMDIVNDLIYSSDYRCHTSDFVETVLSETNNLYWRTPPCVGIETAEIDFTSPIVTNLKTYDDCERAIILKCLFVANNISRGSRNLLLHPDRATWTYRDWVSYNRAYAKELIYYVRDVLDTQDTIVLGEQ